jgi:hypothetical protein
MTTTWLLGHLTGSASLRGSNLCGCVLSRKVESRDASCSQGIEKIQTIHISKSGCLPKREAFFTKIVNSGYQTHFLGKLSWLFSESEQKVVGDIYEYIWHICTL